MGYDSGYYMMGGMHGLWWLFWIVLLGVLVLNGWAHARDWRNRSGQTLRDTPHELLPRWLAGVDLSSAEY